MATFTTDPTGIAGARATGFTEVVSGIESKQFVRLVTSPATETTRAVAANPADYALTARASLHMGQVSGNVVNRIVDAPGNPPAVSLTWQAVADQSAEPGLTELIIPANLWSGDIPLAPRSSSAVPVALAWMVATANTPSIEPPRILRVAIVIRRGAP